MAVNWITVQFLGLRSAPHQHPRNIASLRQAQSNLLSLLACWTAANLALLFGPLPPAPEAAAVEASVLLPPPPGAPPAPLAPAPALVDAAAAAIAMPCCTGGSLEKPGIRMLWFISRCSCRSLISSDSLPRCFANRHAKLVTDSMNSSAISRRSYRSTPSVSHGGRRREKGPHSFGFRIDLHTWVNSCGEFLYPLPNCVLTRCLPQAAMPYIGNKDRSILGWSRKRGRCA